MRRFGLVLTALLTIALPSFACSVPVFRYALERWQPARYDLVVYHHRPLSPADRATFRQLESAARTANVRLTDADLDGRVGPDLKAVWVREGKDAALPRIVLRYPDTKPEVPSVWTGPLTAEATALFDSPARRAIFDRLTVGYAGVVILLLSGDATADDAARSMLRAELPRIAARVKLPAPTDEGPQVESELPLRIEFPVVEVSRTPAEEALVRMLVGSEDGLAAVKGPIAFPVFGRGRALCSLHGKDLTDPTELQRSLEFLVGACSCLVKELNPGVDLLLSANWDTVFDAQRGPPPRVVAANEPPAAETRPAGAFSAAPAELRSPPPTGYSAGGLGTAVSNSAGRSPWLRLGTVAAAALVLLTGFWALRSRRGPAAP
jgi:hypothetical protein